MLWLVRISHNLPKYLLGKRFTKFLNSFQPLAKGVTIPPPLGNLKGKPWAFISNNNLQSDYPWLRLSVHQKLVFAFVLVLVTTAILRM